MTKTTYYRIDPPPGIVSSIGVMTGEVHGSFSLTGKFDDRKVADGWCAILNNNDRLSDIGYTVIRCRKSYDVIDVRAYTDALRKELEALTERK